jgi:hypothetical protein
MTSDRDEIIEKRLQDFRDARVKHKRLDAILTKVMFYILKSPSTAIVNIVGPTGVGKSMLLGRIEAEVIKAKCQAMANDRNMRPFVSTLAVASGHRGFDFKRLYAAVLEGIGDPFGRAAANAGNTPRGSSILVPGRRGPSTAAVRERLERELTWRNTVVWCIDEAHHAVFGGKSGSPMFQLEVFKSIAQRGTTKLCLIGPPELEDHLLSSGQLARRSMTIHFPRYRHNDEDDLVQFASVADKFFEMMTFKSTPDVEDNLDFLYNGTLGCVGILKDWLERAMAVAMERHADLSDVELTLDDLRQTRMPANAMRSIRREIMRMERSMTFNESDETHDEIVHGEAEASLARPSALQTSNSSLRRGSAGDSSRARANLNKSADSPRPRAAAAGKAASEPKSKLRSKPGIRKPGRDLVGGTDVWGA